MGQGVGFAQRDERRGIFLAIFLQAADVDVFDGRERVFLGLENFGQRQDARVRHFGDADVRLIGRAAAFDLRTGEDAE